MAGNGGQGSKWIRREKRFAIYARDSYTCVHCEGRFPRCLLTLDHLTPRARWRGTRRSVNDATNLGTACAPCNKRRGAKSLAEYHGTAKANRIRSQARRVLKKSKA